MKHLTALIKDWELGYLYSALDESTDTDKEMLLTENDIDFTGEDPYEGLLNAVKYGDIALDDVLSSLSPAAWASYLEDPRKANSKVIAMKHLTAQELIDDAVDTIDEAMWQKLGQKSIREPLNESTESKQGQATIREITITVTPDLDTMVTHNVNEEHEQAYREKMEQGDTEIVGVIAKATLQTFRKNSNGDLYTRVHPNAIQSMGLWGIEIDSSEASSNHLKEVAQEELDDLKDELEMLNVDLSNFDEKAQEALDKM